MFPVLPKMFIDQLFNQLVVHVINVRRHYSTISVSLSCLNATTFVDEDKRNLPTSSAGHVTEHRLSRDSS